MASIKRFARLQDNRRTLMTTANELRQQTVVTTRLTVEGPQPLVPECVVQADGTGPSIVLEGQQGKLLVVTLGINSVGQRESLELSIWGSSNGTDWGLRPLVSFSKKFYCGFYSVLLNLAKHPDVHYLRASWNVSSWGKRNSDPMFDFCVFLQESGVRLRPAGGAESLLATHA